MHRGCGGARWPQPDLHEARAVDDEVCQRCRHGHQHNQRGHHLPRRSVWTRHDHHAPHASRIPRMLHVSSAFSWRMSGPSTSGCPSGVDTLLTNTSGMINVTRSQYVSSINWSAPRTLAPMAPTGKTACSLVLSPYFSSRSYWRVRPPRAMGQPVIFTFMSFSTERYYDYMIMYNGPDATYPEIFSASMQSSELTLAAAMTAMPCAASWVQLSNASVGAAVWVGGHAVQRVRHPPPPGMHARRTCAPCVFSRTVQSPAKALRWHGLATVRPRATSAGSTSRRVASYSLCHHPMSLRRLPLPRTHAPKQH